MSHLPTGSRLLLAVGVALALGGCADDGPADPGPSDREQPAGDGAPDGEVDAGHPEPADDADAEADRPEDEGPEGAAPLPDDATTQDREEAQSSGARLTVTDVRVGAHDGFDRITLEVAGEGAVGWFTRLDTEARTHGRGDLVELAGDHALTVAIRGVELPPERDDEVEAFADEHDRVAAPEAAGALTEVVVGTVFEGQKQIFLGLTEETAYRVARFEDPERVVIDLVHP